MKRRHGAVSLGACRLFSAAVVFNNVPCTRLVCWLPF
jgi:hypothetical protein